jgi:hypothetical protein
MGKIVSVRSALQSSPHLDHGHPRDHLMSGVRERHLRASLALVASVAFLGSCVVLTEPAFPSDAARITPPAQYAAWWKVTEACSGLRGDYAAVQWYVVPEARVTVDGTDYDGYTWTKDEPRIVLARGMVHGAGTLVRHEMLHALLVRGGHPRAYFVERCGDIVSCEFACASEAGGWQRPRQGDPIVDPEQLQVSASIMPVPVSKSADSAWAAIVVSAHNPSSSPVWVRLPADVRRGGNDLWYEASGFWSQALLAPDTLVGFGPGQTRRAVFDTKAYHPGSVDAALGTHTLVGGFSRAQTAPISFEVVP